MCCLTRGKQDRSTRADEISRICADVSIPVSEHRFSILNSGQVYHPSDGYQIHHHVPSDPSVVPTHPTSVPCTMMHHVAPLRALGRNGIRRAAATNVRLTTNFLPIRSFSKTTSTAMAQVQLRDDNPSFVLHGIEDVKYDQVGPPPPPRDTVALQAWKADRLSAPFPSLHQTKSWWKSVVRVSAALTSITSSTAGSATISSSSPCV